MFWKLLVPKGSLASGLQNILSLSTFGWGGGRHLPCPHLACSRFWNGAELHSCLVTPLGIQEVKILETVEERKGGVWYV